MKNKFYAFIALLLLVHVPLIYADRVVKLQVPFYYTDDMMFQHGVAINISGEARVGETIDVSIGEHNISTQVGQNNKWNIIIPSLLVGGPYSLTISSSSDT